MTKDSSHTRQSTPGKKEDPIGEKVRMRRDKDRSQGQNNPEIRHGRDLFTIRMLPSPSRLGPGREATARFCRGGESVRHPPRAHLAEHSSLTTHRHLFGPGAIHAQAKRASVLPSFLALTFCSAASEWILETAPYSLPVCDVSSLARVVGRSRITP